MTVGRPKGSHTFTKEVGDAICAELVNGKTLRAVCRMDGMPSEGTVRQWVTNPDLSEFSTQYSKAREIGYQSMADEVLEISDDGSNDWMEDHGQESLGWKANGEHLQRSRLRVDTRKWLLSKALPKVYGDKQAIEHTGADGGPIETKDMSATEVARRVAFILASAMEESKDG